MADVPANFNRWRGEVGLEALTNEEAQKSAKKVKVGDETWLLMSADGKVKDKPWSTTAGMLVRSKQVWFLKMMGDQELCKQEQQHFDQFLQSLTLPEDE